MPFSKPTCGSPGDWGVRPACKVSKSWRFRLSAFIFILGCLLGASLKANDFRQLQCPLCPAISALTIAEDIRQMDFAAVVQLTQKGSQPNQASKFSAVRVIKGKKWFPDQFEIESIYSGKAAIGDRFFVTGIDKKNPSWNTPTPVSQAAEKYIGQVFNLPGDPLQRLNFFKKHLEHPDNFIALDAYDEFARAPYDDILAIKAHLDRRQIIQWLQSKKVPDARRRLFFMLLGVCGTKDDVPIVKTILEDYLENKRTGLDAAIACFLTLAKDAGLTQIQKSLFRFPDRDFSQQYAAISALRFHGTEADVLSKAQIIKVFRSLLDRPRLAELVIPDLARWEDWDSSKEMITVFKENDIQSVRIAVINFFRVCPLPSAKTTLRELNEVDPISFQRAKTLFLLGG